MSGFLLINKPSGPSSHDIIGQLRKIVGIKQIGHAGTLDPFASGLLLVGIGEATKLLGHYVGLDKTYEATLKLGAVSDTQDRTGKVSSIEFQVSRLTKEKIEKVLKSFVGKQTQIPPMYSAKKIGGKRLYKLALEGKEVEREPVEIEVYDIKLISRNSNLVTLSFHVSSGTFIRTLAHDIGQALGCGAYLEELKRTTIGDFKLNDAMDIAKDDWREKLIPLKTVLATGTFDGLHEGHKNYFQQARQYGQRLVAIIARDKIVEKIKGKKPHYSEKERMAFVKQCDAIDRVYLGVLDNIFDFTASLKPDVIALGYDQTAYTENLEKEMESRGLEVKIARLNPYKPEQFKSSLINKPIIDKIG